MKKPDKSVTGIILSGGQSARFGRDKSLVSFNNKNLLGHAVETLLPLCDTILVSSNNPSHENPGIRLVRDIQPGHGPMMGIYSCLLVSPDIHHLVLAVDNPLITTDYYRYVLQNKHDALVAVPGFGCRHFEPLAGYYHKNVLPYMKKLIDAGNFKLPDLFELLPIRVLRPDREWHAWHPQVFHNVNTPEDLADIRPWK